MPILLVIGGMMFFGWMWFCTLYVTLTSWGIYVDPNLLGSIGGTIALGLLMLWAKREGEIQRELEQSRAMIEKYSRTD